MPKRSSTKHGTYLVYGDAVPDILDAAKKYGVDDWVALSLAQGEGGLNYGSVGDNGTSFGPYQLHVGGALPPGKGQDFANSPAGIDYAMRQIASVVGTRTGLEGITSGVERFERPAAPGPEISRDYNWYLGQIRKAAGRPVEAAAKGYHPITSAQEALDPSLKGTTGLDIPNPLSGITGAISSAVSGFENVLLRGGKILLGIVLIVAVVFFAIR